MSRVTKSSDFEVYHVRAGYHDQEWATIAIKGWQAMGVDKQPREIGEILIHSSYGSWGYQWSHLGERFKRWLTEADDPGYIAGKFLGAQAYAFDGEKTVQRLRERLIEARQCTELTKTQARAIWDWIEEHEPELQSSEHEFIECMRGGPRELGDMHRRDGGWFFEEPWEHLEKSLNRSFANFWDQMWPTFQQALREETAVPA